MIPLVYPLTAAALFAIGLYGVLIRGRLIHRLLAVNLMTSAVFLFLVVVAAESPGGPDPVPHAMVLTGIVIALSTTGFALALIRHFRALTHREELEAAPDE